ncbi:GL15505 [Drosophila persimilis]|uniref:GL15505 n=1 Tax=Drosophila persimilis TaxID=7234 RepID=B4H6I8_DROPE|nr:GL15505 [Drosophila persimilis]
MARHIMAVCVVCLLCAHRLHCQDHVESLLAGATVMHSQEQLNARVYTSLSSSPSSETTDQRQQLAIDDTQNYSTSPPSRRDKRHAEHGHGHSEPPVPQITKYFLEKLMAQQGAMDSSGFNSFLQQINLHSMVASSEGTCVPASRLVHHVQPHDLSHHSHSHSHSEESQMPEISASHKSLAQFLLQILGMLSGVGIMLIIALFEGDLMSVFGTAPPSAAHHQHVH